MRSSNKRTLRPASAVAGTLGLLLVGIAATPAHADSIRSRQWHLDAMRADAMWKISTGRGITVAVIDSGVDDGLADLKGQVLDGRDYSNQSGDEHADLEGHGTGVAALIAATGARGELTGSYGLAPGVKILPIRMKYATEDYGKVDIDAEYSRKMTEAIRFAADSKAQIINISMGSPDSPGLQNVGTPELAAVVKYALRKNKLIFSAVGNRGDKDNLPAYPAATPGVIGVGAINEELDRSSFSQWGSQVDIAAPGEKMVHACLGGTQVCNSDGTSDATAIASASAALIWSKHPTWTNNQVLRVLINTMKGNEKKWTWNNAIGYGIVRPRIALKNPGDPGPADEYPLPDLAAASKSASPSPEASKSGGDASGDQQDKNSESARTTSESNEGDMLFGIATGIGAAALLGAAITFFVVRGRRRHGAIPPAQPLPPLYTQPVQQPYPTFGPPQGTITGPPSEGVGGRGQPS